MSASRIVRPPRQAAILSTIVGLHVGAIMLGHGRNRIRACSGWNRPRRRLSWCRPSRRRHWSWSSNQPEPIDFSLPGVTPPIVRFPEFEEQQAVHVETDVAGEPAAGSGPGIPVQELRAPALRVQGQTAGRTHRRLLSRSIPPAGRGGPRGHPGRHRRRRPRRAPGTSPKARDSRASTRPWNASFDGWISFQDGAMARPWPQAQCCQSCSGWTDWFPGRRRLLCSDSRR